VKVSICIATFGDPVWEELAEMRALPSAVAQSPYEIIDEYEPEGTIASSRNLAASRATGDWLLFLDADDELAPGYLDAMRRASEQESLSPPLLFTPAVSQVKGGKRGTPFFFPETRFETGNWIVIGTLVERALFEEVGGFHDYEPGLEDWHLWSRCVKAGASVVKVPDAIYIAHWRRDSTHHAFQRDRKAYMAAYNRAKADVWG
jgi:glycosyltransferase involved in cell wall biosynthesis